jgi:predicted amino acid dehydrogenase
MAKMIERYDGKCDVICLAGLPQAVKIGGMNFVHPIVEKLKNRAKKTPVVDGQIFKDIYLPWALKKFMLIHSTLFEKKKIGFYSGLLQNKMVEVFESFQSRMVLADPYYFTQVPYLLHHNKTLERFIKISGPILKHLPLKKSLVANFRPGEYPKEWDECDIYVSTMAMLNPLDLTHVKDKTIMLDFVSEKMLRKLEHHGAARVISCMSHMNLGGFVNFSIIEGLMQLQLNDDEKICSDNVLDFIDKFSLTPQMQEFNRPQMVSDQETERFAFIIHPLSTKHLFYHPLLKHLKHWSKPLEKTSEEAFSLVPGFLWGNISGVQSEANGKKVEGLIYTTTETPKMMMKKKPEQMYQKLVRLCQLAEKKKARIIGLGAYTKIVGDAGVTIAQRSPIPVTTGNSLSAAATLWAAKWAIDQMGQVEMQDGKYNASAMVIGATGSIGAVSAKILSKKWKNLILVAPRAHKLLELKDDILKISPDCHVTVATNPDIHAFECDLIITTTSGQGEKVMDISLVKPGSVICDVSRPFDISEAEALSRPDVLVVASGEVNLPGDVKIQGNIGLEGNVVYACLAETALLAMEGKYENFTLSRNINYEKVIEIDRLAKKHGVRLSEVMGHHGIITEQEIELCKEHAMLRSKKRQSPKEKSTHENIKENIKQNNLHS